MSKMIQVDHQISMDEGTAAGLVIYARMLGFEAGISLVRDKFGATRQQAIQVLLVALDCEPDDETAVTKEG